MNASSLRSKILETPENLLAMLMLSLMTLLPVIEMAARHLHFIPSIPGSPVYVQHLTLCIGMFGGALAARFGRLLAV